MFLCLLGVGCLVIVAVGLGDEFEDRFGNADPDDYELNVSSCGRLGIGAVIQIRGSITNTSDVDRAFRLDIEVDAGDVRIGDRDIFIESLRPGASAAIDHSIESRDDDAVDFGCRVNVNYWGFD